MANGSIILRPLYHRQQSQIGIYFPYNQEIINVVKKLDAYYSRTHHCWYVKQTSGQVNRLFTALKSYGYVDYSALKKEQRRGEGKKGQKIHFPTTTIPDCVIQKLQLKAYSASTIKTYRGCLGIFFGYCKEREVEAASLEKEQIEAFLLDWIRKTKPSVAYHNQMVNAIKFYYEKVEGRDRLLLNLPRPRKESRLPKVLSEEEVRNILNACANLKQRCALTLMYSSGVRVGELIRLRVTDIDYNRQMVYVNQGKGNKDRQTMLAQRATELLEQYLKEYKPQYWLFEGQTGGHYSSTSINMVLKRAALKAGIFKRVNSHMLRHSFATHLLEHGTDLRYIQALLGHKSTKTTEIYTYISTRSLKNIISPLDQIMEDNPLSDRSISYDDEKGNKRNI